MSTKSLSIDDLLPILVYLEDRFGPPPFDIPWEAIHQLIREGRREAVALALSCDMLALVQHTRHWRDEMLAQGKRRDLRWLEREITKCEASVREVFVNCGCPLAPASQAD